VYLKGDHIRILIRLWSYQLPFITYYDTIVSESLCLSMTDHAWWGWRRRLVNYWCLGDTELSRCHGVCAKCSYGYRVSVVQLHLRIQGARRPCLPNVQRIFFVLQKRILGQIGHLDHQVVQVQKSFQLQGAKRSPLTPDQGLCPWTLLEALPHTPVINAPKCVWRAGGPSPGS